MVNDVEAGADDGLALARDVPGQPKARGEGPGIQLVKGSILSLLYEAGGGANVEITGQTAGFVKGRGVFITEPEIQRLRAEELANRPGQKRRIRDR